MRRPPFCPHRGCENHVDPSSAAARKLARRRWFKHNGSYWTEVRGSVPRFKCLACGKGFSTQTFSLDYYVKRTISYTEVEQSVCSCSGVRATARALGCSCDSVINRTSRLARQCISAHSRLISCLHLDEDLAADGFQSFAVSQYFPNNIHLLIGSQSQYVYFADYVTLRRSGRMTETQKRIRDAFEKLYRASPQALESSFAELLDTLCELYARSLRRPLTLNTDKKQEYHRAVRHNETLRTAETNSEFSHERTDSRAARTRSNPLFPVNYIDRELRKDLADHVRETVRFSRNVNHCMERLWVYLLNHCVTKRYRINDPVSVNRTHAEVATLSGEQIRICTQRLTTRRRFLSFETLAPSQARVWRREHHTPLRDAAKGVLREITRQAHRAAVSLEQIREKLGIETLLVDRPQYLPRYALA